MSVNDSHPDSEDPIDLPTFDLSYDVDDPEDPSQVTVYSEKTGESVTHWITIDIATAVDLADIV